MVLPRSAQAGSLLVGDLGSVRLRAARSPQLSVMMATAVRPGGSPLDVKPTRTSSRAGWSTLTMKGLDRYPDSVMPIDALESPVASEAQRLRELPAEEMAEEINRLWAGAPPGPWRYAADHPRVWVNSLADACVDVWTALSGRWDLAGAVIDREIARIGVAAVTDTTDVLLNSVHRHLRYHDGALSWAFGCGNPIPLADRQLVLVPLLSDWRLCLSFDQPGLAFIGYPALGQRAATTSRTAQEDDALRLILGPVRASALRELDVPRSMWQLAGRMHCAPSNATYHCDQLEAAGLVTRHRRGQSVWAARTARGDELIELFGRQAGHGRRLA
jgi:Helix-turn-helix domain